MRPLSPKEIAKGKQHLKIYGTDTPLPWSTIYTRIAAGQPLDEICQMYGHKRMITLWAEQDGVTAQPELEQIVTDEVEHRKRVTALTETSPDAAATIMEMVNEVAPDFSRNVANFSSEVVQKSRDLLKGKYVESSDVLNLVKAVQAATDLTGHTQRFASSGTTIAGDVHVSGFSFELDVPPPPAITDPAIEAELEEQDAQLEAAIALQQQSIDEETD